MSYALSHVYSIIINFRIGASDDGVRSCASIGISRLSIPLAWHEDEFFKGKGGEAEKSITSEFFYCLAKDLSEK